MYVVTVDFVVKPAHADAFLGEMVRNAKTSRSVEPGCRQFDVCTAPDDPAQVFLYEVYDDAAAFAAHTATAHFRAFDAAVAPWVERKTVRKFVRTDPL